MGFESFGNNFKKTIRKSAGLAAISLASVAGTVSGQTKSPEQVKNVEIASGEISIIRTNRVLTEGSPDSPHLYVIKNNKTGKQTEGYFYEDNAALKLGPEALQDLETERAFQASGLVEPNGNPSVKLHTEVRGFEGYGIKARNEVLVDEKGKVVKLLEYQTKKPLTKTLNK